jgi:DNA-binding NtrC family response regulator
MVTQFSPKEKVLIVEETLEIRNEIERLLTKKNLTCLTAASISEAIEILKMRNNLIEANLMLYGLSLNKTEDLSALHQLQNEAPGVPIVIMIDPSQKDQTGPFLKKNIKDYLLKPINSKKLFRTVKSLIIPQKDFDY